MSIKGEPVEDPTDLDASAYYPETDENDNICALLKVTTTNPLNNELVLEVGGLGVTKRVEQPNGEIWFYLPAQVKNLHFSCYGYTKPAPVVAKFKPGKVYRLTIHTDATFQTVQNAVINVAFLKIILNTEGAVVSLGRTVECEMISRPLEGKVFSERLNYDTYYYKVEHPLYETLSGKVEVGQGLADLHLELQPAYGYLSVDSSPSGAELFVDGKMVGTTPWQSDERYGRGEVELRLVAKDYYPLRKDVTIVGRGGVEKMHFDLKPQFGTVRCTCDDAEAEIWVDEVYRGKGSWTGRLGSFAQHIVEARKAGHMPQSVAVNVVEGESVECRVGAPVAMYGVLEVQTKPELCNITVDGKAVGTSPNIVQLLVGTHKVTLSAAGYESLTTEVTVEHNGTAMLHKELTKALQSTPAAIRKPTAKRTYKVGDYYDDGTKQGVVFEVDKAGKYVKIVSLTQSSEVLQWADDAVWENKIGAESRTNGAENMKKVQAISGWRNKYPAFRWCADLGEGWYLPAIEEVETFLLDDNVHNAVNATLKARGATCLYDKGDMKWYWSSTESPYREFWAWIVTMNNSNTAQYGKCYYYYVRAVATIYLDAEPKSAVATKTYKVGDYYDDGTKQGVVFEVTDGGRHGKIVSLTQSALQWADDTVHKNKIRTKSRTNGADNMKKVQTISGWRGKYPAFSWCAELGKGWYLPAIEELQTFLLDDSVHNAVNATLKARGATRLYDKSDFQWYWSSTEHSTNELSAWLVFMGGGGTFSTSKINRNYVRAVSAF